MDRVEEILAVERDVTDKETTTSVDYPKLIHFDNVTFTYPMGETPAICNVTFDLKQGETLGIVGKTGSGKTTIIRQLLKQYPLGGGEISVNETPLENIPTQQVLKWIGYVPQEHVLFSKTVRENILYANHEASETELNNAIYLSAFEKDLAFLPDGLDTLVGEKGTSLSGGQKQRISIARAMAMNPEILILDDSLSAVDAKTETQIIENIRKERAGKTTIITAHRLSATQHADQIIVMDNGEISEIGTHDQLMDAGGWYKEQYEYQLKTGGEG